MNAYRLADLRRRISATADAIADTEDRVATTLERVATTRPAEAERLRERAAQAREFADLERHRAAVYAVGLRLPSTPGEDEASQPADLAPA